MVDWCADRIQCGHAGERSEYTRLYIIITHNQLYYTLQVLHK